MKNSNILVAVFAVLAAASAVKAGEINFDGKNSGGTTFAALLKTADSCQNDKIACGVPVPEKVEVKPQASQGGISEIKAILKWPDGRSKEGLVVCARNNEALTCSSDGSSKGGKSDFLLAGLMRSMTTPSFDKHSYDNWSGPMLFSCTDVCRDNLVLVGQITTWTKTCGASVTVSTSELSGGADCTVSTSTENKYENQRQCYTHECVCVKGC